MVDSRSFLKNYYTILEENGVAKFIQCKNIEVNFDESDNLSILWEKHKKAIKKWKINETRPAQSLLDLKIELAKRIFQNCCFCERKCGVDRNKKIGNCGVDQPGIASEFLHFGEEKDLVPSYTIFFYGCTFHCVFCQNWDISQQKCGIYIEPSKISRMIKIRYKQGAKNLNWVGGDPTPNLLFILQTLKECETNIPQIWNSNMYCSNETMDLIKGVIDLYLTDFKYGNNVCAKRLSQVDNYLNIIKRNHKLAYDTSEMIIRHLVMPNHVECCSKPIIKWISEHLPNSLVNIMGQYRPEYQAKKFSDISNNISKDEIIQVNNYAKKLEINTL